MVIETTHVKNVESDRHTDSISYVYLRIQEALRGHEIRRMVQRARKLSAYPKMRKRKRSV